MYLQDRDIFWVVSTLLNLLFYKSLQWILMFKIYSLTLCSAALTDSLRSSACSGSFSTLGTGGVSWWSRLVQARVDTLSTELESTVGRDRILQGIVTQNTAGRLLLHRNMAPLPHSVKIFLYY